MPPTIKDVATAAGVSTSTVSRAFSRPDVVDPETRLKVLGIAESLGYSPAGAARTLKTGRTGSLGIIIPDLSNPFFPDIVRGAQRRAREAGYATLLADTEERPDAEFPLARTLARNVDALILCSPRMSESELTKVAALRPIVLINRTPVATKPRTVAPVTVDNEGGIQRGVRHLAALGHRRIGFVGGPATSTSSRTRLAAFRAATAAIGVEGIVVGSYEPTVAGGAAGADDVLLTQVSAVMVYNDIMAAGLLGRLVRLGVDVPGRLSVVGFDDIAMSALLSPALTTLHVPLELAGSVAAERLTAYLRGEEPTNHRGPLHTELIVRESTAAFREA